jgi:hypothetical protein
MKITKKVKVEQELVTAIKCDDCKKIFNVEDDLFELQEFVSISHTGGYGSIFGDMTNIELDICQECFKKRCGDIIRLS